jgi:hypothetical protein
MDLFPAEVNTLKTMVQDWINHPERELESTFGPKGEVDTTTFLNVVQRLRAKGYEPLPQEDKLNILTPVGVRFSIHGMGVIQQFCRDDILAGKPYTAMIKDKASGETKLDLDDYDVRIKVRREVPLSNDDSQIKEILMRWPNQKKAFRMIRRWTFRGQGIRFDLSMIRSTSKNLKGEYRWANAFNTEKFLENAPTYEIEAELVRNEGISAEAALKNLIRGVGEVLRGIQKNILLIRKSVRSSVISEYTKLAGTPRFRGVAPRTLQVKNMTLEREPKVPNIRDGYNVTDKADGLRVMAFCDEKGELWMIDMGLNVYRTGLKKVACANTLLDGEWVTQDKAGRPIQQLLFFDIYVGLGGKKVTQLPFIFTEAGKEKDGRHAALEAWMAAWDPTDVKLVKGLTPETTLKVGKKTFLFGSPGDLSIFEAADRCLGVERIYHTDGLIFTTNTVPIPEYAGATYDQQFKWKPSEENTIDFLVVTEKEVDNPRLDKITVGVKPETGETIRYKTLRLFVGSSRNTAYDDPRATILNELPLPTGPEQEKGDYKPAIFIPANYSDTMASVCYREVNTDQDTEEEFIKTERSNEPIQDRSIIEMAYQPGNDPGWRWIPLRVRYDKTERLQRGTIERTLNSEKVANDNWNSIYDPVTESMIRTGSEEPTEEEIAGLLKAAKGRVDLERKYYDRKAEKNDMLLVRGLLDFHNKWIKERILIQSTLAGGGKALLDVACGKAGDLQKWRRSNADFVLGVDYAGENILDRKNGAYARVLSTWMTNGKENVPPMIFAIGDSSKPLINGEAGSTAEEQRILRSVFRRVPAGGDVPIYVERVGGGRLKYGADVVACMFAIHYFFVNETAFSGFLENIRETLKIGGYFIGCAFDGEAVFNLLRDTPKGGSKIGKEGDDTMIWNLVKQYDEDDLPVGDDGFGLAIDVNFISIGTSHREYLVPFPLLVEKMKMIGCELLDDGEMAELGLNASTNMFDKSYEMAVKAKQKYPMTEAVRKFSFLNRWFIFKRKSDGLGTEESEKVAAAAQGVAEAVAEERALVEAADSASRLGSAAAASAVGVKGMAANASASRGNASLGEAVASAVVGKNQVPTVPIEAGPGAPAKVAAAAARTYQASEVFQFFHNAALRDTLDIGNKGAARYLSLSAPFRIKDPEKPSVEYPTVEHFLAGMKVKLAGGNPDLAEALFSRTGTIHQEFIAIELAETGRGKRKLTEDRRYELLADERDRVRNESVPSALRRHGITFDPGRWATVKENVLREALSQRMRDDAEFQRIVMAAREKGKYLLYYSQAADELGGVRKQDGRIEGENRVGKIIMELAGF